MSTITKLYLKRPDNLCTFQFVNKRHSSHWRETQGQHACRDVFIQLNLETTESGASIIN